jgi:hypothetical protein
MWSVVLFTLTGLPHTSHGTFSGGAYTSLWSAA